jgi:hypothetical protein
VEDEAIGRVTHDDERGIARDPLRRFRGHYVALWSISVTAWPASAGIGSLVSVAPAAST